MIRILDTKTRNFQNKFQYYLNLRRKYSDSKTKTVKKIVRDVRKGRDKSLIKYEKKFNILKNLSKNKLFFSNSEIKKNINNLDPRVKNSIDLAFSRIVNFHKKQKFKGFKIKDKYHNIFSYRSKPIDKIGVYVPGGKASYPSSVLMNCIPAMIAGVREIFMTVPALNNKANPGILYAAKKCKVKRIFKLGGSQAIAAFAFGTENKIV